MLIGANCLKALESVEIIATQDGGPYAYKTKLGWYIVGPIVRRKNGEALNSSRIAVKMPLLENFYHNILSRIVVIK